MDEQMPTVLPSLRLCVLSLSSPSRCQMGARVPESDHRHSQMRKPPDLGDIPAATSRRDLGPQEAPRSRGEAQAWSSHRVRKQRAEAQTHNPHLRSTLSSHSASLCTDSPLAQHLPIKADTGNVALLPTEISLWPRHPSGTESTQGPVCLTRSG